MENRLLTPTKYRKSKLTESQTMNSISTESLHKLSDPLATELNGVGGKSEFQGRVRKDELQRTNESLVTKLMEEASVNAGNTNLTEIAKNKRYITYRDNPVIAISDDASIASQSVDSLTNADSGFCGHLSTITENVSDSIEHCYITPESVARKDRLSVSPCFLSCPEFWNDRIPTTSTPHAQPKVHSHEHVCKANINGVCAHNISIGRESAKILKFESEPQNENQDFSSKTTNELAQSGKSYFMLQTSTEANYEKLYMKIVEEQRKLSCSSDLIIFSSTESVSEMGKNADTTVKLINRTYYVKNNAELDNPETIKGQRRPEDLSKIVKSPSPEKVSQTRANKNRGATRKPRILTSEGRRRSGRFVSMAEAMFRFTTKTPKRFHTKPRIFGQCLPQSRNQIPKYNSSRGEHLRLSNITRRKRKLKLEAEEGDPAVPGCSGTMKTIASPVPFRDSFEERNERLLRKRKEVVKKSGETKVEPHVFRARPMPKFKSPKIKKSSKRLTNAQSPIWTRKKKK